MKKIKRWRYYCDHCKKSGGSGGHMKIHESSCTANPERKCGLCNMACNSQAPTQDMVDLIQGFIIAETYEDTDGEHENNVFKEGITAKIVLKELRELTGDCPACILTAIRVTKTASLFYKEDFDFQAEREVFYDSYIDKSEYHDYSY